MKFLSVCAIVRNEMHYLEEWLEYHLLAGVEHFFIYNNDSDDGTASILERYRKAGVLTPVTFKGEAVQCRAYQHCLDVYGPSTEWMVFIDVDEFLQSLAPDSIQEFLKKHTVSGVAGIALHWVLFGSNGEKEYDGRPLVERFTRRQRGCDKHVKSIVRPKFIEKVGHNPHTFYPVSGTDILTERGASVRLADTDRASYALNPDGTADFLRIAHFHTKSKGEYFRRKSYRPDANFIRVYTKERIDEMFKAHDCSEIEDLSLAALAEQIKENIKNRRAS